MQRPHWDSYIVFGICIFFFNFKNYVFKKYIVQNFEYDMRSVCLYCVNLSQLEDNVHPELGY